MIIDCDSCEVRGAACGDCVIGVLMGTPEADRPVPYLPVDMAPAQRPAQVDAAVAVAPAPLSEPMHLSEPERRALEVLADQGLIPRLRLVQAGPPSGPAPRGPVPRGLERDAG